MLKQLSTVLIFTFFMLFYLPSNAKEVFNFDFNQSTNEQPKQWLKNQGFNLGLDAEEIDLEFTPELGLKMSTTDKLAGLILIEFPEEKMLQNVDYVEIEWGVLKHPQGANWEENKLRVALATMFFFGTEKHDSGLPFQINSAPYFISPFLANSEPDNKVYTGSLYRKGGRYISIQGSPNEQGITTSRIEVSGRVQDLFQLNQVPPISLFAFQMNTKNTSGGASAFIKKVSFFSND